MSEKPTLSQKYENTQRTLQSVVETLTRVDERLGIFVESLNSLEGKVDHHIETCPAKCALGELITRVSVMESKNGTEVKDAVKEMKSNIKDVEDRVSNLSLSHENVKMMSARQENAWARIGDIILKLIIPIAVAIATAAIMYHFGYKGPTPS